MNSGKKIMLSGVKPTGRPHIGNYFGAMRQFVELQNTFGGYVFVADLHAITSLQNKEELKQNIIDVVIDYLAIGLDPKKITFFKQSDVPAHTEMAWIFNCLTTMPYLMRAHAFKDAEAKSKEVNVGLFDYPILMAADILLYGPDVVPVGQDQKQHVEIARDTAEKFNRIYGETFKLPKEYIVESVKTVPGTDGQKMSKSYKNTIPLFATDEEIKKAVMSIPTDSKGIDEAKDPATDKIFALHALFAGEEELAALSERYQKTGIGYKESKEVLIKNISNFIKPLREKRERIAIDQDNVLEILQEGGQRARQVAEAKMNEVREKIGVKLY
jgi:tryptophanyl-tRNA synthetase